MAVESTSTQKKMQLWCEICALLHDLGKLTADFRDYRRTWQDSETGWDDDPHCEPIQKERLLDSKLGLRKIFLDCKLSALGGVSELFNGSDDFCIAQAIQYHENPNKVDPHFNAVALRLLKLADATDARIDRHNPLMCNEQTLEPIFHSNVYGHETLALSPHQTDCLRKSLYNCLERELPAYWAALNKLRDDSGYSLVNDCRLKCFAAIKQAFDQALSDTTRPANDTTLWEHSYAVASLHKTLASHARIYGYMPAKLEDVWFGFLAVGWDGLGFLADSQKVADILARKQAIDGFKKELCHLVEVEACLGNAVYEDERSLIFLVPAFPIDINQSRRVFPDGRVQCYRDYLDELAGKIKKIARKTTNGEFCPLVIFPDKPTKFMSHIVTAQIKIREMALRHRHHQVNMEMVSELAWQWENSSNSPLCPLCRLRPVENRKHHNPLCVPCQKRRKDAESSQIAYGKGQTPFINEIADNHGRVCLLVARFDLDQWLSGNMVRTTFNLESDGLQREFKHIGTKPALIDKGEGDFRSILNEYSRMITPNEYDYDRIIMEIHKCQTEQSDLVEGLLGLYYRRPVSKKSKKQEYAVRYWDELWESAMEEHDKPKEEWLLINALLAKTPTPSTILDVWNSTHKFMQKAVNPALDDVIGETNGWIFELTNCERLNLALPPRDFKGVAQAQLEVVAGEYKGITLDVEVVWSDGRYLLLTKQIDRIFASVEENKSTAIIYRILFDNDKKLPANDRGLGGKITNPQKDRTYRPWREIISSPYLFLALLPADKAPDVLKVVHAKYIEHFGKVQGRLPFSLGAIFCDSHMPMYILLDASRRMLDGFSQPNGKPYQATWQIKKGPRRESGHWVVEFEGGQTWRVPATLGNCENDCFHPHVMLADQDAEKLRRRKSYCRTVAGHTVHVAGLQPGDQVQVSCNTFDFEFLDSTTRRFEIGQPGGSRLAHPPAGASSRTCNPALLLGRDDGSF